MRGYRELTSQFFYNVLLPFGNTVIVLCNANALVGCDILSQMD